MLKKLFSLTLSIMLLSSLSSVVSASPDQSSEIKSNQEIESTLQQINQIMDEMTSIKLDEMNNKSLVADDGSKMASLENELESLGVKKLTPNEVQTNYVNENVTNPKVVVPPSNGNVNWYEYRYTSVRSGVTYAVQNLYAQAVGPKTNLYISGDGKQFYSSSTGVFLKDLGVNLANIYAQKLVGAVIAKIPVAGWLPYELLYNTNISNATVNRSTMNYSGLSTYCYTYVKKDGQADNYANLTFVSNKVDLSTTYVFSGILNAGTSSATTFSDGTSKKVVDYAENYANIEKAIDAYINPSAQKESIISQYIYYNHDKTQNYIVATPYITLPTQVIY
ncbi:hypothetical protein J23TS9_18890 [Paenibacillus sp. J23TS9]|uniref:hypothetical protein n=1 Tax=Paenibacillus sp. J23TS9 TaxID=2807193 RepID=UPI001B1E537D|nr:hypothetical protein [Paenibacillus sp. J23TS9]GIP26759.1 hypothetical protein J23TS9_18890 [Paenibacillus sp. J23TS9]